MFCCRSLLRAEVTVSACGQIEACRQDIFLSTFLLLSDLLKFVCNFRCHLAVDIFKGFGFPGNIQLDSVGECKHLWAFLFNLHIKHATSWISSSICSKTVNNKAWDFLLCLFKHTVFSSQYKICLYRKQLQLRPDLVIPLADIDKQ